MSWTFEQSTGKLYAPDGELMATGYAGGNCGENPEGINNPSLQNIRSVGPLPQGLYTHVEAVEGSKLGPFAIPLIPEPDNEMFGRGGFYMHGDNFKGNRSASEGCIIMPRAIRLSFYNSDDGQIKVVDHV